MISLFVAMPVTYYFMHNWLQNCGPYTGLSWCIEQQDEAVP